MLKGKTVLIAEDDSTMQMFVGGILRQELNCRNLITCTNGQQALNALRNPEQKSAIDLILCDWEMPGANGDEILLHVRKDKDIRHLPFIMTTSRSEKEDLIKVVKLGINNYLVKPYSAADLMDRIKKVMETTKEKVKKKKFSKNTALLVRIKFKGAEESCNGTLNEISLEKGLIRSPLPKEAPPGLYEEFELQIKFINEVIHLKGEIRNLEPDVEDQFSKDFVMIGFKIIEIKEPDREVLELLLA
ncbi:MAG: response regulator [Nitrospina sp.]|jgi:two-component system, chemotaxis family, chemotaxis protein CheY|nr:response regulator [Nitrospina sp.]MBT3875840.1 response regulator [Nitrospina sp.]MBT4049287.1 response regulator [Nitrospina sp.]MBT4557255.1 response regulator [Nitrospina sp.]MBT5347527.1 response regulator [Nitrospina sp.]